MTRFSTFMTAAQGLIPARYIASMTEKTIDCFPYSETLRVQLVFTLCSLFVREHCLYTHDWLSNIKCVCVKTNNKRIIIHSNVVV